MSAAVDSPPLLDSGSDEEFRPSPAKRGRGRGRRNRRGATRVARARASRASAARGGRQQTSASNSNSNRCVINVGDIDSDEEDTPRACSPVSFPAPSSSNARAISPIGIDRLAKALGVADWTPNKTLNSPTVLNSQHNTLQDSEMAFGLTSGLKDIATASISKEATSHSQTTSATSSALSVSSHSQSGATASDQIVDNTDVVIAPVAKKTSRRGLAKRNAGMSSTALEGFNPELPDTAVYSQCVPSSSTSVLLQEKSQSEAQDFTTTESESASGAETCLDSKPEAAGRLKSENSFSQTIKLTEKDEDKEIDKDQTEVTEFDEGNDNDDEDSVLVIRSPSPPPQFKAKQKVTAQRKRLNKKVSNALQTINNVKGRLEKLGKITPKQKIRGRQSDVMIIGEEEGIAKKDMVVKVRYLSTVHRISMNLDDTLHSLTSQLSSMLEDVEEHALSLFLSDQLLDLSLTVRSANLSVADILDCHHIKPSDTSESTEDSISLVVQCRHSRSKTTIMTNKRQPLKCVLEQYAKKTGLNPGSMRLVFDGEDVDPRHTPHKLDMEDMDIVDVIVTR
ncbi:NFATC2-interacting protein [Elysia marginata]|uniref:NFATC2-interacting protein n=1 Tax=Elysia marginata TaxID=1093978 RepID=A0AAV4F7Q8_9GAST|nr:NFATC2-interacting protein [Elysia marginata]